MTSSLIPPCIDALPVRPGRSRVSKDARSKPTNSVTFLGDRPQKILTIGPSMLELLLALDIQPIGHAEYFPISSSTFEQPAQQIPYLRKRLTGTPKNVGTAQAPSIEAIVALQPDLILADSLKNRDEYALLSQIAPTLLFTYSDAERDWQSGLSAISAPLGRRSQQAETLIEQSNNRFSAFRSKIQPITKNIPTC